MLFMKAYISLELRHVHACMCVCAREYMCAHLCMCVQFARRIKGVALENIVYIYTMCRCG